MAAFGPGPTSRTFSFSLAVYRETNFIVNLSTNEYLLSFGCRLSQYISQSCFFCANSALKVGVGFGHPITSSIVGLREYFKKLSSDNRRAPIVAIRIHTIGTPAPARKEMP